MKNYPVNLSATPEIQSRIRKACLLFVFFALAKFVFAQKPDSLKTPVHFAATATVTNNGISLIPTFTLGKPATILTMSLGKKRFSFDPELRYSLEAKPWSLVLWARYKALKIKRFALTLGGHPSLVFKVLEQVANGVATETIATSRFVAAEVVPNFTLRKNITAGLYFLTGHSLDKTGLQHSYFLTANLNFTDIPLGGKFYLKFNPHIYYLKMDAADGFYTTATLTLAKHGCPWSVSSVVNKAIKTDIVSKDFVWNVNLTYAFQRDYIVR